MQDRTYKIPQDRYYCKVKGHNPEDSNSCVVVYLQAGPGDLRTAVWNELLDVRNNANFIVMNFLWGPSLAQWTWQLYMYYQCLQAGCLCCPGFDPGRQQYMYTSRVPCPCGLMKFKNFPTIKNLES